MIAYEKKPVVDTGVSFEDQESKRHYYWKSKEAFLDWLTNNPEENFFEKLEKFWL